MEAKQELKPCPFCGGREVTLKYSLCPSGKAQSARVRCKTCSAAIVLAGREPAEAAERWNKRAN